jgi:hypothetical protein
MVEGAAAREPTVAVISTAEMTGLVGASDSDNEYPSCKLARPPQRRLAFDLIWDHV